MRSPLQPRSRPLGLTVASPDEAPERPATGLRLPVGWVVTAVAWGAAAVLVGWLAVGVLVTFGWLTTARVSAAEVLLTLGQAWLTVYGAPAHLAGVTVDLAPTGITALVVAACAAAAHHAAQQYGPAADGPRARLRAWVSVAGACTGAHLVVCLVLGSIVGDAGQLGALLLGAVLVAGAGSALGALVGLGIDATAAWPAWARRLPRAVGLGSLVLAAGGLAAVMTALVAHWPSVTQTHAALAPDGPGSVLLTLTQLAWWPTVLVWGVSFVLGAGVSLGAGTVVAPGLVVAGPLPALPLFAALPVVPGPADAAWLVVGVLAGGLAGAWVVAGAGGAGSDPLRRLALTAAWQGALGGLALGVAWIVGCWFATGALGTGRLVGMGPRFPELLGWASLPLAAAGALAGVGWALWSARRAQKRPDDQTG